MALNEASGLQIAADGYASGGAHQVIQCSESGRLPMVEVW